MAVPTVFASPLVRDHSGPVTRLYLSSRNASTYNQASGDTGDCSWDIRGGAALGSLRPYEAAVVRPISAVVPGDGYPTLASGYSDSLVLFNTAIQANAVNATIPSSQYYIVPFDSTRTWTVDDFVGTVEAGADGAVTSNTIAALDAGSFDARPYASDLATRYDSSPMYLQSLTLAMADGGANLLLTVVLVDDDGLATGTALNGGLKFIASTDRTAGELWYLLGFLGRDEYWGVGEGAGDHWLSADSTSLGANKVVVKTAGNGYHIHATRVALLTTPTVRAEGVMIRAGGGANDLSGVLGTIPLDGPASTAAWSKAGHYLPSLGPLSTLRLSLCDDRGRVLNLNGRHWSVVLEVERGLSLPPDTTAARGPQSVRLGSRNIPAPTALRARDVRAYGSL